MKRTAPAPSIVTAEQWPAADRMFRSDPRWLGSDDASSVPLGDGRTLWLFGDTFVAGSGGADRRQATFIHNSVGVQTGPDPAAASIVFAWGMRDDVPASLFPEPPRAWLWPLHGIVSAGRLLLFFMVVRSIRIGGTGSIDEWREFGPLGFFRVTGWVARAVSNPHAPPEEWSPEPLRFLAPPGIIMGASLLEHDGFVYAYGWDDDKHVYVARWPHEEMEPEWWSRDGWRSGPDVGPTPVIDEGATEFSVHRDDSTGLFCHVQARGLRGARLAARWAEHPEGPWSEPHDLFAPDESRRDDAFVYAGKAHPELTGASIVATYASNADADVTLSDPTLYYPRFVRIGLAS